MLERYSTEGMRRIWSREHRFSLFLEVELAYLEALEEEGIAPEGASRRIREKVRLDISEIDEIEKRVKHEVIAFLEHLERQAGEDTRFVHFGLTSSDVMDTVFGLQLKDAGGLVLKALERLEEALRFLAVQHKHTPIVGRTHGVHAEVTTFGLVALGWRNMVKRCIERLQSAIEGVRTGKLSGAVGTLAFSSPLRERKVLERLGLRVEECATQVVARDRFAWFFATLGVTASCLEHIALNIRHYHRTEVSEVLEGFGQGQKGSSAMPHKRNPVDCENVCGLARLVRSYCLPAMENVALWHERDISHSSVERVIGPDATSLLEFATLRLSNIVQNLEIRPEKMRENIELTNGGIFSEALLLALVEKGLMRQKAYELVQKASLFEGNSKHLLDKVMQNNEIRALLTEEEIRQCFDEKQYLRHVDAIFERSLGKA